MNFFEYNKQAHKDNKKVMWDNEHKLDDKGKHFIFLAIGIVVVWIIAIIISVLLNAH